MVRATKRGWFQPVGCYGRLSRVEERALGDSFTGFGVTATGGVLEPVSATPFVTRIVLLAAHDAKGPASQDDAGPSLILVGTAGFEPATP